MRTIRQIIKDLGGIRPMARNLKKKPSVVQGWHRKNHLPLRHFGDVLGLARRIGAELDEQALIMANHLEGKRRERAKAKGLSARAD